MVAWKREPYAINRATMRERTKEICEMGKKKYRSISCRFKHGSGKQIEIYKNFLKYNRLLGRCGEDFQQCVDLTF